MVALFVSFSFFLSAGKPDAPQCVGKLTEVRKGTLKITRYCKSLNPQQITISKNYDPKKSPVVVYPGDQISPTPVTTDIEYSIRFFKDGKVKAYDNSATISKALGQADILGTAQGETSPLLFPWNDSIVRSKNFFLVVPNENGKVKSVDIVYESKGRLNIRLSNCFEVIARAEWDNTTRYDLSSSTREIENAISSQFSSADVQSDEREWFRYLLKSEDGARFSLKVTFTSGAETSLQVRIRDEESDNNEKNSLLNEATHASNLPDDIEERCEKLKETNYACDYANIIMFLAKVQRSVGSYFTDSWYLMTHWRKTKQ